MTAGSDETGLEPHILVSDRSWIPSRNGVDGTSPVWAFPTDTRGVNSHLSFLY